MTLSPRIWLPGLTLVLAILLAWSNTGAAPFVFDDRAAILDNPTIRDLGQLGAVLTPPADGHAVGGRPLVNLSLALNYAWGGTDPRGYHAVNLAIHALAALVLYGLVRRTPWPAPLRDRAALGAFLVALLWSLHPLQTETVTCVVQRTESLCALFYLLVLYGVVLVGTASSPLRIRLGTTLAVVAASLGMATKEVMVTAPVVAFLYDRTFLAGSWGEVWRRRRGLYLGLAATWVILAILVWQGSGARGTAAGWGGGVGTVSYLLLQAKAVAWYLRLVLWPSPLVVDYGPASPVALGEVLGPLAVVAALLAVTFWALVRRPVLGFLGAAFFLILAPSSSLVPLSAQGMAEHRMYLPLATLVVLLVAGLLRVLGRVAGAVVVPIALLAGLMTWQRNAVYASEVSLWTDTVAQVPANVRARVNLGAALVEAGQPAAAALQFEAARRLQPNAPEPHANLCHVYLKLGRVDEAVAEGEAALALAPGQGMAALNLAEALYESGNGLAAGRRFSRAIDAYRRAVALVPGYAAARNNLANALLVTGEVDAAIAEYREVLRLRPDDRSVQENLAQAEAIRTAR
ncbi:MAG TPA: tetratricopeptide repeat protein [Opitutaceae bacterium]|nr:tetratricopeptide repeat protein [Opitutaceae bacterium]HND60779.1 tetratricopeptide repeat protein [Opitutaceae bacterium]